MTLSLAVDRFVASKSYIPNTLKLGKFEFWEPSPLEQRKVGLNLLKMPRGNVAVFHYIVRLGKAQYSGVPHGYPKRGIWRDFLLIFHLSTYISQAFRRLLDTVFFCGLPLKDWTTSQDCLKPEPVWVKSAPCITTPAKLAQILREQGFQPYMWIKIY